MMAHVGLDKLQTVFLIKDTQSYDSLLKSTSEDLTPRCSEYPALELLQGYFVFVTVRYSDV